LVVNNYLVKKWVMWNELRRYVITPAAWIYFSLHGVSWGKGWRILGLPIIQKASASKIKLGDGLILRSWTSSNPVAPYHRVFLSTRRPGAEIIIGNDCGITGGSIIAAERVEIGVRTLIGGNCLITDTDFHPLEKNQRWSDPEHFSSLPIRIGSNVFIGSQTILLKGVTIGDGSVIGAGSVVTGEIPANVIAAGNPAKVIREL
jgi:acetyltransferase-like isoleucine patch superfamily enzyme